MDLNKATSALKKYTSAQSAEDLNRFIEDLPHTVGTTLLAIAAVTWCAAGASGLYASIQMKQMTELRGELEAAQALKPTVPTIKTEPVNAKQLKTFVDRITELYPGLKIQASGSEINISSRSSVYYDDFRRVLGHIHNGGDGWKIEVKQLCLGRECKGDALSATLKINKVSVGK